MAAMDVVEGSPQIWEFYLLGGALDFTLKHLEIIIGELFVNATILRGEEYIIVKLPACITLDEMKRKLGGLSVDLSDDMMLDVLDELKRLPSKLSLREEEMHEVLYTRLRLIS